MNYQTLARLFLLLLLFFVNSRFLFIKNSKTDNLSVIPFFSLFISIMNILAYGINPLEITLFLLTFFVCLWNFRALLRFNSALVIDAYGPLFKLSSTVNLIFTIVLCVLVIIFIPAKDNKNKFKIQVTSQNYSGNFTSGFAEQKNPFEKKSLVIYEISKKSELKKENSPVSENLISAEEKQNLQKTVLFLPPKNANFQVYKNFLYKLAFDGYKVYFADFNSSDAQWFNKFQNLHFLRTDSFRYEKLFHPQKYESHIKSKSNLIQMEMRQFVKTVNPAQNEIVFLLTEDDLTNSLPKMQTEFPGTISGTFDLNINDGLYSSGGWGPIENTDPLLAFFLGLKKEKSGFISSHLASTFEKFADKILEQSVKKLPETDFANSLSQEHLQ